MRPSLLAFQRPPLKHLKLQVGRNTFGKLYRLTTRADASMGFLPELSGGEKKPGTSSGEFFTESSFMIGQQNVSMLCK